MKEGSQENVEKMIMFNEAELLRTKYPNDKDFIFAVGIFIHKHGFAVPERYEPKSIIESRLISPEEAFSKGILSCGAVASMSALMLKHVGMEVKLVYGEWSGSVDHAWISVFNTESNQWVDYDLTRSNPLEMPTHVERGRTDSWEDVRDVILHDHETFIARSIERRNSLKP